MESVLKRNNSIKFSFTFICIYNIVFYSCYFYVSLDKIKLVLYFISVCKIYIQYALSYFRIHKTIEQ